MSDTTPLTVEQTHYRELRSYFETLVKYTLAALGLIVGVALTLLYRDMAQVRSDVKVQIDQAREAAIGELARINKDAATIARDTAQKSVDEAFRSTNIGTLIDAAAKKQLASRVMASIQSDISYLSQIANAGMQMRIGLRAGLDQLLERRKSAPTENVRAWAKSLFESIASDYESVLEDSLKAQNLTAAQYLAIVRQGQARISADRSSVPELTRIIVQDRDLHRVAAAFSVLREATGTPFQMFDIDAVRQWCDQNKRDCKL